eukprot:CAMPEP_0206622860 /NCGR_PEP_ID=MMETSP0325_2-20121206/63056_1 /ASSEMBLY_ACC=CAM_ASM_000347 /TAXON_ID=2866 /ORGANISM="Crypthecodinium cohnii, Strain Seligo" /LENGTH=136 /DNA_ID=CAMNT_0054146263 /DNA_START=313 /DNA_END=723 /DNA_ORIENTATION=-
MNLPWGGMDGHHKKSSSENAPSANNATAQRTVLTKDPARVDSERKMTHHSGNRKAVSVNRVPIQASSVTDPNWCLFDCWYRSEKLVTISLQMNAGMVTVVLDPNVHAIALLTVCMSSGMTSGVQKPISAANPKVKE